MGKREKKKYTFERTLLARVKRHVKSVAENAATLIKSARLSPLLKSTSLKIGFLRSLAFQRFENRNPFTAVSRTISRDCGLYIHAHDDSLYLLQGTINRGDNNINYGAYNESSIIGY